MSMQRFLLALTAVNLGLLVFLLSQAPSAAAPRAEPVLRGRALEIVDEQGRIRAAIRLHAAEQKDGKTEPEVVVFRLFDRNGRPGVKMTTAQDGGAGLLLLTPSDSAYIRLDSVGPEPSIKLTTREGREQVVKP